MGEWSERDKIQTFDLGRCIGGEVIQSGEPLIIEHLTPITSELPATRRMLVSEQLQAALVVAVRIGGKPLGALMVGHRSPFSFQLFHLQLLIGLANQLAAAINNARLYERLATYSVMEERERLAREMHDGLAQMLAHPIACSQAAEEHLRKGETAEATGTTWPVCVRSPGMPMRTSGTRS